MKKHIFAVFAVITVLCSVFFSGCAAQDEVDARQLTYEFINALLNKDYDTARSYYDDIDDASFNEFCVNVSQSFGEAKDFSLKQTAWSYNIVNGVKYYTYSFELTTDTDKGFVIQTKFYADSDKFATIDIIPKVALSTQEIIPFKFVALAVSCVAIGFCVWMIVDCVRRKMGKKWLWILVILSGFSISVTFGYEFGINWGVIFAFPFSSASADSLTTTIKAAFPLGTVIYCILRKKLTVKPPYVEVEYKDITE